MMRTAIAATALLLTLGACWSGPASMSRYQVLRTGMSYGAVVEVLGEPGEEMSRTTAAGTTSTIYRWKGRRLGSMLMVAFQDGKVLSKTQVRLK